MTAAAHPSSPPPASPPPPAQPPPPPWPRLRDELRLHPGPATRFGAPTWTLHDPAAQRFFRLGWMEMEMLRRWHLADPAAIARSLAAETTLVAAPEAVEKLRQFLVANHLTAAVGPADSRALAERRRAGKKSLASRLMHNYLFLRIPLFRPDRFLAATLGLVGWMFTPAFLAALALAGACGLFLIVREWALFRDNLADLFTLRGGLFAAAALGLSKAVHEFGHAYAAKRLGLKVPSMGVALMCFAPVLWTDTTEAWKLPGRRERLSIGASGVLAEFVVAAGASLLWPLLPDGGLKTASFMLAGSIWILTLTVNVNPCMRYDGYYLLSDYWDIPGLQPRSFALAKWWLRERLFGFGLAPPEAFPARDRAKLISYALCTWVYRFFLFMGIALLVYHLFFKALGLVLMLVELAFFIALPVVKEVAQWISRRKAMTMNARLLGTLTLALAGAAFLIWPWHDRVSGAALLAPARRVTFIAPIGGRVAALRAVPGGVVAEGEPLFTLESPDLDGRIEIVRRQLAAQREKLSLASLDPGLRLEAAADWEHLERLAEDLAGLLREKAGLEFRAPFAGRLVEVPEWLAEGGWVRAGEPLMVLAGGGVEVQVFIPEHARGRVRPGGRGLMYPGGGGWEAVAFVVEAVEEQSLQDIAYPELTSVYGGPLAAQRTEGGGLEAERAVFRVRGRAEAAGGRFLVGEASLEAEPQSLVADIWRRFLGLLVRESGL